MAREAGNRSKIAVYSRDPNIDPVGACVGARGSRVQAVVAELGSERIDIVQWERDVAQFIKNALSPAKVLYVRIDEQAKVAHTVVPDDQLSLAIGKEGQNARLAARLTGWRIDIKSEEQAIELGLDQMPEVIVHVPEPVDVEEVFEPELEHEVEIEVEVEEVELEAETADEPQVDEIEEEQKPEEIREEKPKEQPVVQEISAQDLAGLTNIVKRKSWQERFGSVDLEPEASAADTPAPEKQETTKPKKKREKVITDLSQLQSIFDDEK